MRTPYKMKGYSYPGTSPVKKEYTDEDRKRAVKLSKENEGKPGFNEWRDKVFGGKTTVKGGISTTINKT